MNLEVLDLNFNELSGSIPATLGNLANLREMDLSSNQLNGSIPIELGNLTQLQSLSLESNAWSGSFSIATAVCAAQATPPLVRDCQTLLGVSHSLGGWLNWAGDLPLAEWTGVTSDPTAGVTALVFVGSWSIHDFSGLNGRIPAALGNLPNLRRLSLTTNQFRGPIPPALGKLTNLSGPIPAELGNLANLDSLDLAGNQLSNAIPPELGRLANLEWLNLSGNRLRGSIPPELGALASLETLYLYWNELSGPIPPELGRLAKLVSLDLSGNKLSGPIPAELSHLANLKQLYLNANQLSGSVPLELGRLVDLRALLLGSQNRLTGCLPESWRRRLDTGRLTVTDLTELGLSYCGGTAADPVGAVSDRAVLVTLYSAMDGPKWRSQINWLSERPLGAWHGVTRDTEARVTALDLRIQISIGPDSSTYSSIYSPPGLRRPIPADLGSLVNLRVLDLWGNQLSGPIPAELDALANLRELYLGGSNQITGCIPEALQAVEDHDLDELGLPVCADAPADAVREAPPPT